jgi:2-methylcitrate dehydratase PrpD
VENQVSITDTLSSYIGGSEASRLPEPVVAKAKIHILDTIGAIVSGSLLKPGRLIIDFVRSQGGQEEATVSAGDFRSSIVLAALANGTMAHADETDDAHFSTVSHPGSVAVSAALPVAEREHRSGAELICAVVLGYDVMCRASKALDRQWMHDRGLHAGSMGGNFAAAAVASRLLKLQPEQIRFALAFAGSQASGLSTWRQEREHIDKALSRAGLPARNGVTAALWAKAGFTGTPTIFEGPYNFIDSFSEKANPTELIKELGSRYEILDTSIKIYPAGQPIQATLHGFFTLMKKHQLEAKDIDTVIVKLPEEQTHTINDRLIPDANCQYQLAIAMLDGKVDFHNAHDTERMTAADVVEQKKRVKLVADPELTRQFPAVRAAIVEIHVNDGRRFEMLVDRLPGAPYNPLSTAEVENKFLSLTSPVLGTANSQKIIDWVRDLERRDDVSRLCPLLQKNR